MLHTEKLQTAGGTLDVRHNIAGDAVYVFIKSEQAKIFSSLETFIAHVYFGADTEHFTCNESELFDIYERNEYSYKQIIEQLKTK